MSVFKGKFSFVEDTFLLFSGGFNLSTKKNEIEYFGGQNQNEHQSPAEREFFISPAVIRDYLRNSIIIFHNNVNGCYLQSR